MFWFVAPPITVNLEGFADYKLLTTSY